MWSTSRGSRLSVWRFSFAEQLLSFAASSIVVISGRAGFADFINGHYDLESGVIHDGHPAYRKTTPIPSGCGAASGRFLHLFYHSGHNAWAVSQNLGSNGVIAYALSSADTPESLRGARWKVSNRYGEFIEDAEVTCCLLAKCFGAVLAECEPQCPRALLCRRSVNPFA